LEAGTAELTSTRARRVARAARRDAVTAAIACALLALCFVVPFLPGFARDELVKTSLWGLTVLLSSAGWGSLIAAQCWPGERVSLSLRAVWGLSAFAFFGGICAMVSGLSAVVMLAWLVVGAALLARSWWQERHAIDREGRARFRAVRINLALTGVVVFLVAAVVVHYLGGASDISSNPYDDDIVYYPFAKQLLQRGTLIDPFSFRRMSTLGGQALYHAVLLIRVPMLHLNLFDRAMCFLLSCGLIASHRVGGRKAPLLARLVSIAFLVVLPNTSINSASYYSGLAFFLAFFQSLERLPENTFEAPRAAARRLLPLALTGAALCTLRQNYQAAVGMVVIFSYGFAALRLRKSALRAVIVEGVVCCGLVGLFVLPWLVLLYRSSDTFLFPLLKGTFRAGVDVQSQNMTVGRFAKFFTDIWLQPDPIYTLPLFMLVGLFVRETSVRRPLASQWLGAFVSIVILCQAFSLSDWGNLARYDYGFATASVLLTWQTVAAHASLHRRSTAFAWAAPLALLIFALSAPLIAPENRIRTKKMLAARLRDTDEMARRTVPMQVEPPVASQYRHLQSVTPAGSRVLVMLDEPYFLDYARNEIWNLDMPGTASPQPGIPCFQGPELVAEYLHSQGIRYLAFVQPESSVYLYRREIWFDHLYDPDEIWRIYAPYMVDVMDNLVALAVTRVHLHEESSMILLDLEARK
jgi:hypothetical protein